MRLSIIVAQKFNISRRYAKEEITNGFIKINGQLVVKDIDLEITPTHDIVYLKEVEIPTFEFDINEYLLEEFDDIKFLYKKPFMHSDRLKPTDDMTMSDIVATFKGYRSLSRLDYTVDGVIGIIKSDMAVRRTRKSYIAIVEGKFENEVLISYKIDAENRKKVEVDMSDTRGNPTMIRLLDYRAGYSLVSIDLEKAARHQVRVFCSILGHPILGDTLYDGKENDRVMLHCNSYAINGVSSTSKKYEEEFKTIFYSLK